MSLRKVKLGDIASIQTGPFGSQLHQSDYVEYGTPIITVEHLGNDRIGRVSLPRVTDEDKERLNRYHLKEGDTVFSRVGSVDRASYVHKEEDGWLFSGRCLRVRPEPNKVDPRYLSFYLQSTQFTSYIKSIAVGATMPSINTSLLETSPVSLVDFEQQEKIGHFLDTIERKIELNRRMNETLEQIGQILFKKYFVDNPESEGWEKNSLDEIADFKNGLACQKYPSSSKDEKGLRVIKIREMSSGFTDSSDTVGVDFPENYIIENGDLLFAWSGTLMTKIWTEGRGALNQHIFKVTSEQYPKWFYYLWVDEHLKRFKMIAKSKAVTMGHIKRSHLSEVDVKIPPKELFDTYGELLSTMLQKRTEVLVENNTLIDLRDTLLPKLISGEIGV